jgi:hypothetical protein
MMPTKKQLEIINETLNWIFEYCPDLKDYNEDILFNAERIQEIIDEEENIEGIEFNFLGEQDPTFMELEYFINLSEQIKTIQIVNKGLIRTKNHSYYIVSANEPKDNFIIREYHDVELQKEKINLNVIGESFIIGLAACKLDLYDDDYWGTSTEYQSVQIIYENENQRLNDKEELDLLNSYLFEIADSSDVALILSEIYLPEEYYYLEENENYESLRELEPYNEGMRLFTSAVQIKDAELKFLNFYKVLEHFSPIAVNIEANELMRKKLDSPKSKFEDGDFIRSIFQLANSMRDRYNDEDLIKGSFSTCFDFIGLIESLPDSIQKKINSHLKIKKLEYGMDKQIITTATNIAAKIIYRTRNKVVHAKSNFTPEGDELSSSEFDKLNEFMKLASSQAIRWYSRQPNHLKQEIIK